MRYDRNRIGKHNMAHIGKKNVSVTAQRIHLKTLKMEWRDGRIPLTLLAVL